MFPTNAKRVRSIVFAATAAAATESRKTVLYAKITTAILISIIMRSATPDL